MTPEPGVTDARSIGERYQVRWYEPGDRDGLLSLFESAAHWVRGGGEDWFAWKYEDNPAASDVPIVVASHEGAIVGARPCLPLRMYANGESITAIQTCDTVVDESHRRQGIFTEMTRFAFDYYAGRGCPLAIHLPNDVARQAYSSIGARVVGDVPTYYRIQRPLAMLQDRGAAADSAALDAALTAGAWTYLHAQDVGSSPAGDVHVERHETVPAATLARLYRKRVPDRIHAVRDEPFYRWRFSNPDWAYRTFVARRDGVPVAGLITGTRAEGPIVTYVTEVVPLVRGDSGRAVLEALLSRALADHDEVDVVVASGWVLPRRLLARFGFHGDDSFPLSVAADPTVLIVSRLAGDDETPWRVAGLDPLAPESWLLPFSEQDTA